jgi:hypothetical protein
MFVSQLLEKNQQNLEFPKYHNVNTSPTSSGHFWRTGTKLPARVCVGGGGGGGGGGVISPVSISSAIPIQFSWANFENISVSQIEKE